MLRRAVDELLSLVRRRPAIALGVLVGLAAIAVFAASLRFSDDGSQKTARPAIARDGSTYRLAGAPGGPDDALPRGLEPLGPVAPAAEARLQGRPVVDGQVVVRFDADTTPEERARTRQRLDLQRVRALPLPGVELLAFARERDVEDVQAALEAEPGVLYAEPNFIYRMSQATPNDARFSDLWGLDNTGQAVNGRTGTADADIDAPEAWQHATGEGSTVVAVVDTGVAYDHPDIASNVWTNGQEIVNGADDDGNGFIDDVRGWDFVSNDADPRDLNGHGTHVAGTIGASGNDGTGVTGVNWDVSIMPLRVLDATGSGTSASVAAAFSYAGREGAEVVNGSFGGPSFSQAVLDSISRYPDTLFVVAAGNEGANNDSTSSYPCNYVAANIVCAAASTQSDSLAAFSNYGATNVDLAAPGASILSTVPAITSPFADGFESELQVQWSTEGIVGAWGRASDDRGSYLTDSPEGSYQPNSDSSMPSRSFTLSGATGCTLNYFMTLDTEKELDGLLIEASRDGTAWVGLAGWSGSTGGKWVGLSTSMTSFDGVQDVHLRFRLVANDSIEMDGASIDDVVVRCISTSYSGDEYGYSSGTSMAAPHVAGAAALLASADPGVAALDLKAALLDGADRIESLAGKTASGGRLNLRSSLARLAVAPGPSPTPSPTTRPKTGGGGGGGFAPSTPTPTPSATPSARATPAASPTPTPPPEEPSPTSTHGRSVTVRLRRHLVARGRVSVTTGHGACADGVPIKIKRNGRTIASDATDGFGHFRLRLPDRIGRYRVVAPPVVAADGEECMRARSPLRRHGH